MTSTRKPRFPRPVSRCFQSPPGRSHVSSPSGPVPAKSSPFPLPARHARGEAHLDPPSKRITGTAPREERLATYPSVHGQSAEWCRSCDVTASARSVHQSEEHTSELQSLTNLVCRLLLEKK